jgi:hypothetical protein
MVAMAFRYRSGARTLLLLGVAVVLAHVTTIAGEPEEFQGLAPEPGSCPVEETGFTAEPISFKRCDSGGQGSKSCESGEGINPMGVHDGCGISCQDGYYACCRRGNLFANPSCICIVAPNWPYTPAYRLLLNGGRGER